MNEGIPGARSLVTGKSGDAKPTTGFKRVVKQVTIQAKWTGRDNVTSADVLAAIVIERESHAAYFLQKQGIVAPDADSEINPLSQMPSPIHQPRAASRRRPWQTTIRGTRLPFFPSRASIAFSAVCTPTSVSTPVSWMRRQNNFA